MKIVPPLLRYGDFDDCLLYVNDQRAGHVKLRREEIRELETLLGEGGISLKDDHARLDLHIVQVAT